MKSREKTGANTAIVRIGIELRKYVRMAIWVVPMAQWLYIGLGVTLSSIIGDDAAYEYLLSQWIGTYILPAGYLLTLLCLLIALGIFIEKSSVKNLVPVVLNAAWVGLPVFSLMMGWAH